MILIEKTLVSGKKVLLNFSAMNHIEDQGSEGTVVVSGGQNLFLPDTYATLKAEIEAAIG